MSRPATTERDRHDPNIKERYDNIYPRFHLSHIGMSSFDEVTMLLIENENQKQRLLWQQESEEIKEKFLSPGQVQKVVSEAINNWQLANK